ncbi:hypothetical protein [Gordonia neofelifaecis]|uniref:Uncharacterized protein n=1 Tax=Gordonia neofelifaecis NRRL B-59395 TaxID=644548 RepID=F1YKF8_9ACTN|nr:hypothetical protein [Gordonia neofelifaecis]EGD54844.1 hypothetical protein SCNU_11575 [Gordonia neofelifaecis NRRL B-59395]
MVAAVVTPVALVFSKRHATDRPDDPVAVPMAERRSGEISRLPQAR